MKKLITTLLFIATLTQSCETYKLIPLKGTYKNPKTFYFDKSFDEVWSATIKTVMKEGYSIHFLDKPSGAIVGVRTNLYNVSTHEDEKGNLANKQAFVVTEKVETGVSYIVPSDIKGDWNILVYPENGKMALNINFLNIDARPGTTLKNSPHYYNAVSTGNFEKTIAESLKFQ